MQPQRATPRVKSLHECIALWPPNQAMLPAVYRLADTLWCNQALAKDIAVYLQQLATQQVVQHTEQRPLLLFRHGLRAPQVGGGRWQQVECAYSQCKLSFKRAHDSGPHICNRLLTMSHALTGWQYVYSTGGVWTRVHGLCSGCLSL